MFINISDIGVAHCKAPGSSEKCHNGVECLTKKKISICACNPGFELPPRVLCAQECQGRLQIEESCAQKCQGNLQNGGVLCIEENQGR